MNANRLPRRWPLLLVAPASCVAVWSGWVGLGGMAGFGTVQPLPGIVPWTIDTAITLPIGVEAYAAYALSAWLSPARMSDRTRGFAKGSAIVSLILGAAGQAIYHLLVAAGRDIAPWPVTVLVSCLPVAVLGMAAALAHMIRGDSTDQELIEHAAPAESADRAEDRPANGQEASAEPISIPAGHTDDRAGIDRHSVDRVVPIDSHRSSRPARPPQPASRRSIDELRAELGAAIEEGSIDPSNATAESIRTTLRCSPARARQLRDELADFDNVPALIGGSR